MELINANIKYVYYLVIAFIIYLLVVLIVRLVKLSNNFKIASKGIDNIEDKINIINAKCETIKKSFKRSWSFFIEISAIIAIFKAIRDDYKSTPKRKRSLKKSVVKGCIRKYRKVKKII